LTAYIDESRTGLDRVRLDLTLRFSHGRSPAPTKSRASDLVGAISGTKLFPECDLNHILDDPIELFFHKFLWERPMRFSLRMIGTISAFALLTGCLAPSYVFTTIDVPDARRTEATGINDAGEIVGRLTDSDGATYGFRYDGTFHTTGYPSASLSYNNGISNGGQIVGNYYLGGTLHGFLSFPPATIDVLSGYWTQPRGINRAGEIVGEYLDEYSGNSHGFYLAKGSVTTVDVPLTSGTSANAINDAGQIAGTYQDNSGVHGFVDTRGSITTIDFPSASSTMVWGINNAGQMVGAYNDRQHGFVGKPGSFHALDFPGALWTVAYGINSSGRIARTYYDHGSGRPHGFLATPKGH
jgi:probable HAF family extracellular repeat protein